MSTPTEITSTNSNAFRIFVGNLTQNVESAALETAFAEFGKVLSVRVIKKKYNSNVFGFVDMEDLESANKAVAAVNGREFDGKNVSVELARERSAEPAQPAKPKRTTTRRPRAPKADSETADATTTTTDSSSPTLGGKSNGTSAPRRRNTRRTSNKDSTATTTTTAATTSTDATPAIKTQKPKREKKPVAPKESTVDRQQSTTTLFVRNIPYSFDDAKLLEAFKDCSPKSAHVIVNKHTNRSKGFGFVEFDDVANQQKGLTLNKLNVENRELSIKIALVPQHNTETAATATTPDTTTVTV